MNARRKKALIDDLVVWGVMLSLAGLMALACVMVFKYVAMIPGAFEASTTTWSNPMDRSDDDNGPAASGRQRMTPRERYQSEENSRTRDR